MSSGTTPPGVEKGRIYGVAAVDVGERPLSLAWGRLVFTGNDAPSATASTTSWTMDVETIPYGVMPTDDYAGRIALKDGRTLTGEAVLESTNGRLFHFESRGEWTSPEEFES